MSKLFSSSSSLLELPSQRVDELEVMVLRLAMSQAETTLVAN